MAGYDLPISFSQGATLGLNGHSGQHGYTAEFADVTLCCVCLAAWWQWEFPLPGGQAMGMIVIPILVVE